MSGNDKSIAAKIMDNYINILSRNLLFKDMSESEIETALSYLKPKITHFEKGSYITLAESEIREFYILLEGRVQVVYEDALGRRALMAQYTAGDTMLEIFAVNLKSNPFATTAVKNTVLASIQFDNMLKLAAYCEIIKSKISGNLYVLASKKKVMLYSHLIHASRPNIREKLISFLQAQKEKTGKSDFIIPFNKKELAEYLFINRQAMMKELAAMKKEKIIDFKGLHFILKTENP